MSEINKAVNLAKKFFFIFSAFLTMEQSSSSTVATIDENLLSDDDINNRKMTDIITSLRAKSNYLEYIVSIELNLRSMGIRWREDTTN